MATGPGSLSRHGNLVELTRPDYPDGNVRSAATKQAAARANLGLGSIVAIPDATTYTVLATDSGKTHVLPNLTANCTISLPTAAAGLEYEFVGKAVAADAQNWIIAAGVPYIGAVVFLDTDDPADTVAAVYPNGSSNDNFTVVTPGGGTRVKVTCDGTNWIINGVIVSATVPTFAD